MQEQLFRVLDTLRAENFESEFEQVYESKVHPIFFGGGCEEAVQESKRTFKPLIIYLHHDSHEDTPAFCM